MKCFGRDNLKIFFRVTPRSICGHLLWNNTVYRVTQKDVYP